MLQGVTLHVARQLQFDFRVGFRVVVKRFLRLSRIRQKLPPLAAWHQATALPALKTGSTGHLRCHWPCLNDPCQPFWSDSIPPCRFIQTDPCRHFVMNSIPSIPLHTGVGSSQTFASYRPCSNGPCLHSFSCRIGPMPDMPSIRPCLRMNPCLPCHPCRPWLNRAASRSSGTAATILPQGPAFPSHILNAPWIQQKFKACFFFGSAHNHVGRFPPTPMRKITHQSPLNKLCHPLGQPVNFRARGCGYQNRSWQTS